MKTRNDLNHYTDTLRKQILDLRNSAAQPTSIKILPDALIGMENALEELSVAQEELRVQNEALLAAREQVQTQHLRYQNLFQTAPDAYLVTDVHGIVREANMPAAELLKMPTEKLTGKAFAAFIPLEERRNFRRATSQALSSGDTLEWDCQIKPHGGVPHIVAMRLNAERDGKGKPVALRWLVRDITHRQQALQQSEESLRMAMKAARLGHWDWNIETGEIIWSREHNLILGLPPDQSRGNYEMFLERVHPDDRECVVSVIAGAIRDHHDYEIEYRAVLPDGSQRWIAEYGAVIFDGNGQAERTIGVVRDITAAYHEAEEHARQQHFVREQEQEAAVLEERNRMAMEIHDTLAQGFTGISIQLEAAEDALTSEPDAVRRHIVRARDLAHSSLVEARRSVQALRPQMLEEGGLVRALERLTEQMTTDAVPVSFALCGEAMVLPAASEQHLLRIAQEALTNACRHGRAECISVLLRFKRKQIVLEVEDDGCGMDISAPTTGFGLSSMQERAALIGGAVQIKSRAGQGTLVAVTMPGG